MQSNPKESLSVGEALGKNARIDFSVLCHAWAVFHLLDIGDNNIHIRLFSWAPKLLQKVAAAMKLEDTCSLERKALANLDSILKSRDITLPTKVCIVNAMFSPVIMYRCEIWTIKEAECWRIDDFGEDSGESLGLKIKPVNPKGNQSWIFTGRTGCWSSSALVTW